MGRLPATRPVLRKRPSGLFRGDKWRSTDDAPKRSDDKCESSLATDHADTTAESPGVLPSRSGPVAEAVQTRTLTDADALCEEEAAAAGIDPSSPEAHACKSSNESCAGQDEVLQNPGHRTSVREEPCDGSAELQTQAQAVPEATPGPPRDQDRDSERCDSARSPAIDCDVLQHDKTGRPQAAEELMQGRVSEEISTSSLTRRSSTDAESADAEIETNGILSDSDDAPTHPCDSLNDDIASVDSFQAPITRAVEQRHLVEENSLEDGLMANFEDDIATLAAGWRPDDPRDTRSLEYEISPSHTASVRSSPRRTTMTSFETALLRLSPRTASATSTGAVSIASSESLNTHESILSSRTTSESEVRSCIVCCTAPANAKAMPCGHAVCCAPCLRKVFEASPDGRKLCPICRGLVRSAKSTVPPYASISLPRDPSHSAPQLRDVLLEDPASMRRPRPHPGTQGVSRRARLEYSDTTIRVRPIGPLGAHSSIPAHDTSSQSTGAIYSTHTRTRSQQGHVQRSRSRVSSLGTTTIDPSSPALVPTGSSHLRANTTASTTNATQTTSPPVVLVIAQSRKLLNAFVHQLCDAFPAESVNLRGQTGGRILVNNLHYVPLHAPNGVFDRATLSAIRALRPSQVLLCADFCSISSFEACVRCDLQLVVDIPRLARRVLWLLIRRDRPTQVRVGRQPIVEDADVLAAKHYVSMPRMCVTLSLDNRISPVDLRKLGSHLYDRTTSSPATAAAMDSLALTTPVAPISRLVGTGLGEGTPRQLSRLPIGQNSTSQSHGNDGRAQHSTRRGVRLGLWCLRREG